VTRSSQHRPLLRTVTRRLWKPELDVRRIERVRRKYDRDSGYAAFHDVCRRSLGRSIPDSRPPLLTDGFERLRVMAEPDAAAVLADLRSGFESGPFRRNGERVHAYAIDDPAFTRRLLASSLTPEVDARVTRYFQSEYFVHWYVVTRARPIPREHRNSFLWHCDRGPEAHLKLLVYLNGVEEHGGYTEFLDLAATRELSRSGYLFGSVADRRDDLHSLASRVGSELAPRSWRLSAGEALLFQPRNVLHRGRMPTRSDRYMLSLCLLPSPIPWREALARGWMSDLSRDPKWHPDAMELARGLAEGPP
jgi:hypothetical protein